MAFAVSSSSFPSVFSNGFAQVARPLLAPLGHWLHGRTSRRATPAALQVAPTAQAAPVARVPALPLRVLRVVDGSSRQCAGRMVISGRMADVCAELDRLAAREAQRNERPTGLN